MPLVATKSKLAILKKEVTVSFERDSLVEY